MRTMNHQTSLPPLATAPSTKPSRSMPNEATTAMTLAIRSKDVSQAAGLIDAGFPADHVNINGESLLHFAASTADMPEMARMLIGRGADVECRSDKGRTPLTTAAEFERVGLAAVLLEEGAHPDAPGESGWLPLRFAMEHGGLAPVLRVLLEGGASLVQLRKSMQIPALHYCVDRRNHEGLTMLLEFGEEPRTPHARTHENALVYAERMHLQHKTPNSLGVRNPSYKITQKIITTLKAWMDCQNAKEAIEDLVRDQSQSKLPVLEKRAKP